MSAVSALDRLLQLAAEYPGVDRSRLVAALREGPAADAALDYDTASQMLDAVPLDRVNLGGERTARLRGYLTALIAHASPTWRWLIPVGRRRLADHLEPEVFQVLVAAGLYGEATPEVVRWWDAAASEARSLRDQTRGETGRIGERLTSRYERERLDAAGLQSLAVEIVGFEDNTLGFDVRSYSIGGTKPRPKYIEVKATERTPPDFYMSRNEWKAAERLRDDFYIHLWHLPTEQLYEIPFEAMLSNIPLDQGSGEWDSLLCRWKRRNGG